MLKKLKGMLEMEKEKTKMENLLQRDIDYSFVITVPEGETIEPMYDELSFDYKIKKLDFTPACDMASSATYNPFCYIKNEWDVRKLAACIMKNTVDKKTAGDSFLDESSQILFESIVFYLIYKLPEEQRTFSTVIRLLKEMNPKDGKFLLELDRLFSEFAKNNSGHMAISAWANFRQLEPLMIKETIISLIDRLNIFDLPEVKRLTSTNTLEFETVGTETTALFVCTGDSDSSMKLLTAILYTQMFNVLFKMADNDYTEQGKKLPVHVRFLLGELENIGEIPELKELLLTARSREISAVIKSKQCFC